MNYLWEVALRADDAAIPRESLRYVPAAICSPYIEVSFADLNQAQLDERLIEANPLYRFTDIFAKIFDINLGQSPKLRRLFFHICMQYFIQADLRQGLSKSEYYLRFILRDLLRGACGPAMARAMRLFTPTEQRRLLGCMLTRYRCDCSIILFRQAMRAAYPDALVYASNDNYREILLYIGKKDTPEERARVECILDTFLPINYVTHLFWEHHFGIIDIEVTMMLDEMVLF